MVDWKSRITFNPWQCGGSLCIRGMRIRVIDVLDLLVAGLGRDEVLQDLPDLEAQDIDGRRGEGSWSAGRGRHDDLCDSQAVRGCGRDHQGLRLR